MSKRTADAADIESVKAPKAEVGGDSSRRRNGVTKGEDEGMGEFEDRWEDEMESEDEEEEEDGKEGEAGEDEDALMLEDEILEAEEEEEEKQPETHVYLPSHGSRPLEADEVLEPDHSVYQALHPLEYTWPCLSFDVLRDNLGWERNRFPHTAFVVAGTQAGEHPNNASGSGMMGNKGQDEVVVMKWAGLRRTQKDGDDSDDDDEDDDADETEEDAHLEYLSIPHTGGVNRIRARPLAPSPELLPPMASQTPYHVATMAETGKVHIFDVRPMIDALENPASAPARTEQSKRPLHTITAHGRNEGFALDWHQDGRLLTGDIASKIFLTTLTPTGFVTKPDAYLSHTSSVEDLQWSPSEQTVFASCSADRSVKVWDVRVKNKKAVTGIKDAHDEDVNVISWNKGVDYLLLSGGDEGGLKVWDLRNLKSATGPKPTPVAQFDWHKSPITSVEWHPTDTSVFAAASADDSVTLWDLGVEADDEEAASKNVTESGIVVPPQLLFVHQGQKDVKEVHWHPQIPGMVLSTAGDGFNIFKTISA